MIRQPPIIIQPREIRPTDVADLQLLMPARSTRITQRPQLPVLLRQAHPRPHDVRVVIHQRLRHVPELGQRLDLEQAGIDRAAELRDLPQQAVRLPDLVRRLLQPALGGLDPPVALVDVPLQVVPVVPREAGEPLLVPLLGRERQVLGLERFRVDFGTGAGALADVGEEVVRAVAKEKRVAEFGRLEG